MKTGDRIKQRREALGISVEDVAHQLGKHRATIYRYESNEIETLPTDVLEPLAVVLHTTPAALMGWEDFQDTVDKKSPAAAEPEARENEQKVRDLLNALSELGFLREGQKLTPAQIAIVRAVLDILEAALQGGELDNQVDQVSAP